MFGHVASGNLGRQIGEGGENEHGTQEIICTPPMLEILFTAGSNALPTL